MTDLTLHVLTSLLLIIFGVLYNQLTAWIERKDPDHGYAAFLVVGGVAGTLGILALLLGTTVLWVLLGFVLTGMPMIAGSVYRHLCQVSADRAAAQEVLDGE